MTPWLWLLFPGWPLIAVAVALFTARFMAIKHPPRANTPAAGTTPVPGQPSPSRAQVPPVLHAPAPDPYGTRLMTSDFYDTGIVVTHDHHRRRTVVWLPPVDDEALAALLDEEGRRGV